MDADAVHQEWLDRSGEYSPRYYAYYGPNETSEAVHDVLGRYLDPAAAVLELGCSSGRHLARLRRGGYSNLNGVEINRDAAEVMADAYPELATAGTFHYGAIETVITEFETDQFDAVFSVETLQHIHPDNDWLFAEIARVTGDVLVTVENESEAADASTGAPTVSYINDAFPLYYRDWNAVFTDLDFVEVDSDTVDKDTLRAFRSVDG